jgi:hypothetical protein
MAPVVECTDIAVGHSAIPGGFGAGNASSLGGEQASDILFPDCRQ